MAPRPVGSSKGVARDKIYEFVRERISTGLPPTVREVQEAMGYRSVQSAREQLERLVEDGRLTKLAGRSRGYSLPETEFAASTWLPILGRVQAGALTTATEDIEGYVAFPNTNGREREEMFALRVQGESMVDAGIHHGDVVVVRWQNTATPGDIVVALVGDEATVKTFVIKNGQVVLRPENENFDPIVPDPEELIILGKVIELRRFFESGSILDADSLVM